MSNLSMELHNHCDSEPTRYSDHDEKSAQYTLRA